MRNKWFLSLGYILALLIAIFLLLPLFLGLIAERKCKQILETINNTTPLNVKIIDYGRGWFSSEAIAQVALDKLEIPHKELYQLTITANITHGPIFIDWARFHFAQAMVDAAINLNSEQNIWLKREPNAQPIATIKIKFKLNGTTDIAFDSPSLNYQNQELTVNWRGLKARSNFSPLYNKVKTKIDFAGIEIKSKNHDIKLGEITSIYEGNKISNDLWLGERNIQCKSFSLVNANNHIIAFNNLNISNLIKSNEKNLADIIATLTIADLNINGANYNQNRIDGEINKIDQTLLAKLHQQLISNNIAISPTSLLFDVMIAALNNGSKIDIKQLNTNTPWGKLSAAIKIIGASQPNNIGLLAAITNSMINTNIKVQRALALHLLEKFYKILPAKQNNNPGKQAETLLTEWQQSGKILTVNEDNSLLLNVEYKNNELSINGKQLIITTKL